MRDRFEQNRCVSDPIAAHKLLVDGEEELFKSQHWQPKMWPKTIGGNAYGRVSFVPDWVLDYWHPLEKAQYPEYFARREQRKEEFIRMWEKEYGNDPEDKSHHH
ncbi:hypothetical protein AAG570_007317 [Ranatra chinensis]|uniref:NADH dehydrogenase [ubiquinone] 1 beta subcomplex subunit 9 n=1 Tax=Ranatra chinensis TaxID=642074 RepID=A0ABD0XVJ2_9HEMI